MARITKDPSPPLRRSERLQVAKVIHKSKTEVTPSPTAALTINVHARRRLDAKVTKKKGFRRPQQRKRCHLLNMPGELRNKVYRYALLEPHRVHIKATGPGEPALLRACTSKRHEAKAIYYAENRFTLRIVDYDGAALGPFHLQRCRALYPRKTLPELPAVTLAFSGHPHWENLMAWMKAIHSTCAPKPETADPLTHNDCVVAAAIEIVETTYFLPWEGTEAALCALYKGLRGTNSPWVKDVDRIKRFW